ncbi:DUF5412 domain-containing protein [Anaerofustis stercorihominis]|uniref:DUF5412 domain-containing protein n=1 Tax=Anaerofustis stercorihominis TaxID=214853 RepID=UPI00214C0149|nr:DUF5412 domain-containing protein [Anaerofustis stercorihominis]MCR2033421.1 DUF5412 domain-containing protein [Anaerofustis stercorihominis]
MKKLLNKKIIFFVIILFIGLFIHRSFFSMSNLPNGKHIFRSSSPSHKYTFNAYLCDGGATTDYAIRGEIIDNNTGKKRNIYWDYRVNIVKSKWINDNSIVINGKKINDVKKDKYDFRNSEEYDEDFNYEHFYK